MIMPPIRIRLRIAVLVALLALPLLGLAREEAPCTSPDGIGIWLSPARPAPGQPVRVMAVMSDAPAESLTLRTADGATLPIDTIRRGGPPWSLAGELPPGLPGDLQIEVRRAGEVVACRAIAPHDAIVAPVDLGMGWSKPVEAFYSAWIETLFDAPASESLSFPSLQPVLRDPGRNFLRDHLAPGEDSRLPATPDCADLPYYLRAYFAWKIGLPVVYRACDRGTGSRPPRCGRPIIDDRFTRGSATASGFSALMRQIADTVHSGSARTGLGDESTDFYPVPLDRQVLWPGTVYADPYGHTLIIAKWQPQAGGQPGVLYAVDAQPDNSVARKRFWEGNFLFADIPGAGPGFKAFRPVVGEDRRWWLPGNARLAVDAPQAAYSDQQAGMAAEDFYATLSRQINPRGLAPEAAYDSKLDALVEQLETRVEAVNNGENYLRRGKGGTIGMPRGAAIFETQGPWEDYATPSRDLRLLIALDVLAGLPGQIVRHPELFDLDGRSPQEARAAIEARHARRIAGQRITYTRSDGRPFELSVADIFARRAALEMGYNPNDCVEIRWGAPPDADEMASCRRQAPAEQRSRMAQYRPWFQKTQRPPR